MRYLYAQAHTRAATMQRKGRPLRLAMSRTSLRTFYADARRRVHENDSSSLSDELVNENQLAVRSTRNENARCTGARSIAASYSRRQKGQWLAMVLERQREINTEEDRIRARKINLRFAR